MEVPKDLKEKACARQKYIYKGQLIYEWDQTLDDVNIYIQPPKYALEKYQTELKKNLQPGQQLPKLEVLIQAQHIKVGVKGNPPYIDEDLQKKCTVSDSVWMIEDEELHICLQKMLKGEVWSCIFKGHDQLDAFSKEEVQKKLMLERFQEENPGFDFSSAQFNGMAPDPRTFMGGISYK